MKGGRTRPRQGRAVLVNENFSREAFSYEDGF